MCTQQKHGNTRCWDWQENSGGYCISDMSGESGSLRMWKCSPKYWCGAATERKHTAHHSRRRRREGESTFWCGEVCKEHLSILRRLHHLLTCLEKTSRAYLYSPCSWKLSCLQHFDGLPGSSGSASHCEGAAFFTKLHSHFYFVRQHFHHPSAPLLVPLMLKKNLLTFPFISHFIYQRCFGLTLHSQRDVKEQNSCE